jgi:pro-kumamolisin-like protein/fibronectin type III domain protein/IPT/TIG domain-containing protein
VRIAIGSVAVIVAAFIASPVAAATVRPAPAAQISTSYALVSQAPRLPFGAREVGTAVASAPLSGAVALKPRDPAALERAALAVSNPKSPSFHHYIAKGSFAAEFGPTAETINAVKAVLQASHLTVTSVSSNGLLVHFSGTVGAAQQAFRTQIANVRLVSGRTGTEATRPVSFPANIAGQVSSVIGLDTLVKASTSLEHATRPAAVKPVTHAVTSAPGAPDACAAATKAANIYGGLTNEQIAHAYGVDGLYNVGDLGAGQTVAIYELEPFATSDVSTFDRCYFGATKAAQMLGRLHTINVDGGGGSGPGSGESILDIEDVAAMAPNATIDVYEAPNTIAGGMDEFDNIIAADDAQVVTSSWGYCEIDEVNLQPGYINVENDLFEQAALQGQTVLNSSGDSGSDSCAYDNPVPAPPVISQSDPASEPFVLGVGGTTMTNASNPPTEQVWNDGSDGGASGGGPSAIWGAPSWQQPFITGTDKAAAAAAVTDDGFVPCKQSTDASLCREAPDVSAQADEFTGAITIYTALYGGWTTEGGTSSSSPLWAGVLAEINASSGCRSTGAIGFAAPALYAVAAIPADYNKSFNDVTIGNNDDFDIANGHAFEAGPGYDMATGLGTPKVTGPGGSAGLANYLCALSAPASPRPTITSLSTPTLAEPLPGSLTVNGTGFSGATAVSIDAYAVPSADWSVTGGTSIVISPVPTAAEVGTASWGPQDGSGRAVVSVTGSGGAASLLTPASTLLYVDTAAGLQVPSVEGISAYGGSPAGNNLVTVFGSGFTTSGPDAITSVTVGGVASTNYTVLNPSTLSVLTPPYESGTTVCAAGDSDPAHDVCQAQLVVTNANGSSPQATILPPYSGQEYEGVSESVPFPACVTEATCEIAAAVSEYDYLPRPVITSVTTTSQGDPTTWASERGTTIATVQGSGFDYLGLEYANVGKPSLANNQDFSLLGVSPTEFEVILNGRAISSAPVTKSFTVQSLGGRSASWPITFAGRPKVTALSPTAGTDAGGTHVTVTGAGFAGVAAADGGSLSYHYPPYALVTLQYTGYAVASDTSLKVTTPGNNPGLSSLHACTVTGCSTTSTPSAKRKTLFDFYQPGAPRVTSLSVTSGPASGGTRLVIHGVNLSDAVKVTFGSQVAAASNAPEILSNGSSTTVRAVAPPGKAGSSVHVRVTTVETRVTHGSASPPNAASTFTYHASVASAPRHVTATKHATSLRVKWQAPASDGGHPITHYRVRAIALPSGSRLTTKTPPPVVVSTKNGKARSAELTGLRRGWRYQITVRAVTSKGLGLAAKSPRTYLIRIAI